MIYTRRETNATLNLREGEAECRALTMFALRLDVAAVRLNDMLDDREP